MKHTFIGMLIALALVLALVVGMVAFAENDEAALPEQLPAADAAEAEAPEAEAPAADAEAAESTALQEALDAYGAAKASSRQEALEDELKQFVEAGKLTQEQADLILNYYQEQQSLKDGVCPNCGYEFQSGAGKGGRGNGGLGGKGGRGKGGFGGKGGRGMMGQEPSQGQGPSQGQEPSEGQDSGSADGTSFWTDALTTPDLTVTEDI